MRILIICAKTNKIAGKFVAVLLLRSIYLTGGNLNYAVLDNRASELRENMSIF